MIAISAEKGPAPEGNNSGLTDPLKMGAGFYEAAAHFDADPERYGMGKFRFGELVSELQALSLDQ